MKNEGYTIQPNFEVANCSECKVRPKVYEFKKSWGIGCPKCGKIVKALIVEFEKWDKLNKTGL